MDIRETLQKKRFFCEVSFFVCREYLGGNRMDPSFIYEAKGQILIIHMPKELDHHNCRNLRYETDLLMSENYISKLIFDFSRTTFMDSSGIGILLNRYKQIKAGGGVVSFYGASPQIQRILRLGGMLTLMPQFESKEEAIYK